MPGEPDPGYSPAWDAEFTKGISTVDEQPSVCLGCRGNTLQRPLTSLWMPPVEGADADREHDVVRLFVRLQDEVLGSDLADTHAAGRDLVHRGGSRPGDGDGGSVDTEDVAGGESRSDRSGGRPGTAPDLEDAGMWLQRKRVHDRGEAGRQTCRHGRRTTTRTLTACPHLARR